MQQPIFFRPDEVIRSGTIQPFNVVSASPVAYARGEVNPFIKAVRPAGSMAHTGMKLDGGFGMPVQIVGTAGGGLGIVSPEVIRTLGQTEADYKTQRWYFAAGALVLGLVGGYAISKLF